MRKKSKGFTLHYFEEYTKEEKVYHIYKTDFNKAERQALQKLSEIRRIDFKKRYNHLKK
ncbi:MULTISPECIES: hypothetical protein [Cytobacillus]|uniref:hypothetical protein n=1 Tax=Cytobacillus TaxID=2675230 RepID=UPI000A7D6759|nr:MULTISPECIES: hypothetical protein [Cytobacillus]MCA1028856.1 hypothetical protein [Cytobacillus kochii]MEC1158736.1 hypothetical protein [Cytobacillus horneckiae]NRG47441.1 hypothetical protein [Bacillus sp. CRN 9]